MSDKPTSEAQALNAAIIYQIDRAFYLLLSDPTFARVAVEYGDDLQLDDRADDPSTDHHTADPKTKKIAVGQVKFTLTGENPFQNRSRGLWQTLLNWLRLRKKFHRYQDARFLAITNGRISRKDQENNLIVEMHLLSKQRAEYERSVANASRGRRKGQPAPPWLDPANRCVKKLRLVANDPSNDSSLQACFNEVCKAEDDELVELVSRITLLDEEFEELASDVELVCDRLQIPASLPRRRIHSQLRQWFLEQLELLWRAKKPAFVARKNMMEALEDFKRDARRQVERHRAAQDIELPAIAIEQYFQHDFVRKLRETGINSRLRILRAVECYLRVQAEQNRLVLDEGCPPSAFTALANQLRDRWYGLYSNEIAKLNGAATEEDVLTAGVTVFNKSTEDTSRITFREADVEHTYVREGELHRMADRRYPGLEVWWKPRAEDLGDV